MIAVIDYGAGNIRSVVEAFRRNGADCCVTADHETILRASGVVIPGVGEAAHAMSQLRQRGLDNVIRNLTVPVLGICIGMQILCSRSEEGDTGCLGIFDCEVQHLSASDPTLKIPHMGWDTVSDLKGPLFEGLGDGSWMYFVHSFAANLCHETAAVTDYCAPFSAALQKDNFMGVQFHPEKSAAAGARLISNFITISESSCK